MVVATRARVAKDKIILETGDLHPVRKHSPWKSNIPRRAPLIKPQKKEFFQKVKKEPKALTELILAPGKANIEGVWKILTQNGSKKKRKVWEPRDPPISDPTCVPKDWDAHEPDLSEDDFESQIARCHERIKEGIFPAVFELRLKKYIDMKDRATELKESEPRELTWDVVRRIQSLKRIYAYNEIHGDKEKQQSNVRAIMAAYRSGDLKAQGEEDIVTYWANGKLIKGPTKYQSDEFYELWKEHGPTGFWQEWLGGSDPKFYLLQTPAIGIVPPEQARLSNHNIEIRVKSPVTGDDSWAMTLPFVFDAGSHAPLLFENDIKEIEHIGGYLIPKLGQVDGYTVNGTVTLTAVNLNMCLYSDGKPLHRWLEIRAVYLPGSKPEHIDRLPGVWMRHMVHLLTNPDNRQEVDCSNDMVHLATNVPTNYSVDNNLPPPAYASAQGDLAPNLDELYPPLVQHPSSPPPLQMHEVPSLTSHSPPRPSRHPWNNIYTWYPQEAGGAIPG